MLQLLITYGVLHYSDAITIATWSQITGVSSVCWAVCSSRSKKISKLRVSDLCEGYPPVTGGFPLRMANIVENVSIGTLSTHRLSMKGNRKDKTWWRHQMETISALLAFCAENSPVPGEFPTQRPVTRSFEVSFDLRPNKRLSKQSWGWWSETPSSSLWRHRNEILQFMRWKWDRYWTTCHGGL